MSTDVSSGADHAACVNCGLHDQIKQGLLSACNAALHHLDELYGSLKHEETGVQRQLRAAVRAAVGERP